MIRLADVKKVFNAGAPNEYTALDGVSLEIPDGALTVLKGPSGSGKTTLLSLIGCMARPTAGRIFLTGIDVEWMEDRAGTVEVSGLPERFLTFVRRRSFGFVFQQFHLIRGLSALENVLMPALPTGDPRGATEERARALLERFGVARRAATIVDLLSGGELQRIAIARALINDPRVIIADEPTAHLDTALSRDFMELALSLRQDGRTVVLASHDPVVFAAEGVDTVVELRDGRVVGAGTPS